MVIKTTVRWKEKVRVCVQRLNSRGSGHSTFAIAAFMFMNPAATRKQSKKKPPPDPEEPPEHINVPEALLQEMLSIEERQRVKGANSDKSAYCPEQICLAIYYIRSRRRKSPASGTEICPHIKAMLTRHALSRSCAIARFTVMIENPPSPYIHYIIT